MNIGGVEWEKYMGERYVGGIFLGDDEETEVGR